MSATLIIIIIIIIITNALYQLSILYLLWSRTQVHNKSKAKSEKKKTHTNRHCWVHSVRLNNEIVFST